MIITAALCWYDEPPELLERCVRGMANLCDRVVALDGAYRRYPGAQIASPPEQAETIRRTAAEVGLDAVILTPERLWAGQVEKRSYLIAMAAVRSDWIAVVDADHIIHADRDAIRAELAGYPASIDVLAVPYRTPAPSDGRSIAATAATNWHARAPTFTDYLGLTFRALPGLHVEGLHYYYSAWKDGRKVAVLNDGDCLPRHTTAAFYEVEHVTLQRDERRILAGRAFCNDRVGVVAQTGQEDDVPGLPAPIFDYTSVPY